MNLKNLSSLAVISLGLCFSAVTINPAHSSELTDDSSEEILISQLRGHNTYDGRPQLKWGNYSLGRVIGGSGGIISIRVEDGTVFQANTYIRHGSDVLVTTDSNGNYYLAGASESEWISRLEQDYGVKRIKTYLPPLRERTAPIWRSMGM